MKKLPVVQRFVIGDNVSGAELHIKALLDAHPFFANEPKFDNIRFDWLDWLEFDRFYPRLKVAVEVNGPVHRTSGNQRRNDRHKWRLCKRYGVYMMRIDLLSPKQFPMVINGHVGHLIDRFRQRPPVVRKTSYSQLAKAPVIEAKRSLWGLWRDVAEMDRVVRAMKHEARSE